MQLALRAQTRPAAAPLAVRPRRAPFGRAPVAARAAATLELEGDAAWSKTYYPKGQDTRKVEKKWYIVNAEGQTLGRLASLVARYVRGKHLPTYSPSMDMGAMLIVVNADKVVVGGSKTDDKLYKRHVNGGVGSMKVETFRQLQARVPERIIEKAVWGMLPKGRLGRRIKLNLKIFKGASHPHEAQAPLDITDRINGRT